MLVAGFFIFVALVAIYGVIDMFIQIKNFKEDGDN